MPTGSFRRNGVGWGMGIRLEVTDSGEEAAAKWYVFPSGAGGDIL